jgi:hypothetical protein
LRFRSPAASVLLLVPTALAMSACGSDDKKSSTSGGAKPAELSVSVTEAGKGAKFTVPASTKGGLVNVTLANKGKKPHGAQLIRLTGNHTTAQALKTIGGNKPPPSWLRAEGGPSAVPGGQTGSATVILPAGKYAVVDTGGPGSAPPASADFTVTAGTGGKVPSAPTTIAAAEPGHHKFKWQISGTLKPGDNRLTFVSKGKDSLHFVGAFRVNGDPSLAKVEKGLSSNGKPPKFIDGSTFTETTVLDGGKSEVASLNLRKPGRYVLFCPLTDRDGGKPHHEEGLLTKVTVK